MCNYTKHHRKDIKVETVVKNNGKIRLCLLKNFTQIFHYAVLVNRKKLI